MEASTEPLQGMFTFHSGYQSNPSDQVGYRNNYNNNGDADGSYVFSTLTDGVGHPDRHGDRGNHIPGDTNDSNILSSLPDEIDHSDQQSEAEHSEEGKDTDMENDGNFGLYNNTTLDSSSGLNSGPSRFFHRGPYTCAGVVDGREAHDGHLNNLQWSLM